MPLVARAKVLHRNKSQALQFPKEVELPASVREVEITAIGAQRVITPAGKTWAEWFASEGVAADFMPTREQPADTRRRLLRAAPPQCPMPPMQCNAFCCGGNRESIGA